ncbi:YSIRK-type signal peptide-containing protein [Sphingobacterium sp.]
MSIRKKKVGLFSCIPGNTFFLNNWCENTGPSSGFLIQLI